jgi:hypothetical protein
MANRMGKPGALFLWVRYPHFGFYSVKFYSVYAHTLTGICLPYGLLRLSDGAPSRFQDCVCL